MSIKSFFSTAGVGASLLVAALVAGSLWGSGTTEAGVERAIRQNFRAAGQLAQLQVEGEKMRRYEKEMFIYAANAEKRRGYVKEFNEAHAKLLALLGAMQDGNARTFSDDERADLAKWHLAATFYGHEFGKLASKADAIDNGSLDGEQRAALTLELNNGIKAGKDRFRELLGGADRLRAEKEASAQSIARQLDGLFGNLRLGMLLGGLATIAAILFALRERAARQTAPRAMPRVEVASV